MNWFLDIETDFDPAVAPDREAAMAAGRLARYTALPAEQFWFSASREEPLRVAVRDIHHVVTRVEFLNRAEETRKGPVTLWAVTLHQEAMRCLGEIVSASDPEDLKTWKVQERFMRPGVGGRGRVCFAVSDGSGALGMALGSRSAIVHCGREGPLGIDYSFTLDFAFVATSARRRLLGSALTLALARQAAADMGEIADGLERAGSGLKLRPRLVGTTFDDQAAENMLCDLSSAMGWMTSANGRDFRLAPVIEDFRQ